MPRSCVDRCFRLARPAACLLAAAALVLASMTGCGTSRTGPAAGPTGRGITARQLVEPGALMSPAPSEFNWSPAGALLSYVATEGDRDVLKLYDPASGEERTVLDPSRHRDDIDPGTAQWSPSGDSMLLIGEGSLWLLDVASGGLRELAAGGGGKTAVAFSPSGDSVSYVMDNDLYVMDVEGGKARRLTTGGGQAVYNACLDWVYTEELATRAAQPGYSWSPDGRGLVYMRLDDSGVHNDPVTDYRPVPAEVSFTRYPSAGTANPVASLHYIAPAGGGPARDVRLPEDAEYVLPFFTWTPDSSEVFFITVSRDHGTLRLNAFAPATGSIRTVITETDGQWINEERYAAPLFMRDGKRFLWLSERDGFMHLYLYTASGDLVRQLTSGDWMIDTSAYDLLLPGRPVFLHEDGSGASAYFSTTRDGALERQAYRLDVESGKLERVSGQSGFHMVSLSADGAWMLDQFSDVDTPPVTVVSRPDGSGSKVLARCAGPSLELPEVTREFVTVKAHDGTELHAQMVKPEGFDPEKRYGVVVHWYGGPGLQLVSNRYGATNIFNHIERDVLYTQEGFIVWRLDNRGSFGRGHAFEIPIDGLLGAAELDDQLAGIEHLRSLPYVDPDRVGTDGKSFGGFMTLNALIREPSVFRCGVAGSGPTDWKYYDTIYTERYMDLPESNQEGYAASELVSRAAGLERAPLIIHGLADTNVHLQNSVNFIEALERSDRPFEFVPLPNEDHHYEGDGLATALSASASYFRRLMGK